MPTLVLCACTWLHRSFRLLCRRIIVAVVGSRVVLCYEKFCTNFHFSVALCLRFNCLFFGIIFPKAFEHRVFACGCYLLSFLLLLLLVLLCHCLFNVFQPFRLHHYDHRLPLLRSSIFYIFIPFHVPCLCPVALFSSQTLIRFMLFQHKKMTVDSTLLYNHLNMQTRKSKTIFYAHCLAPIHIDDIALCASSFWW